ncbi:nucleotidyltransferase family protein [uncultured Parvimonas sp.]|uniref:tRNA(Met) cytidine acetate ligase n=1 Tax=uncultured Parvimonas sp. TaxID=747372 RepID=UPI0025922036|nr:nucleotidyltransferase family protein [uncultured Parvimonas sp.]
MKVSGIISEYNPFHLGHKYQIDTLKNELDTFVISIMSGDFVQRGECAILDKYTRASLAVKNGVDLVIELPFYFSLQSAENFAKGGISILNKLNIVDYLCFGFECEKKEDILEIAKFQLKYKNEIEEFLNSEMKLGKSYAVAYKNACIEINKKYNVLEIKDDFFISNNILSIEYVKNLILSNSKIIPFPIKRKGENYNSENYNSNEQLSASAIRKAIYENNFEKIENFIDKNTFEELKNSVKNNILPNEKNILEILKYNILINQINPENIVNYENGILNLIKKNMFTVNSIEELVEKIQSKRYKKVRIKRFIYNYLLNITNDIKEIYSKEPEYISVLAFNKNGQELLKEMKNKSNLEIITTHKSSQNLSELQKNKFELEQNARKIYKLFTNNKNSTEFISFLKK